MTYLDVVALIRRVSQAVNPNGTFIHGSRLNGSLSYGDKYPVILLEPFPDTIDPNTEIETTSLTMGFMMQDRAESSIEQQEVLIGEADVIRRAFIAAMKLEQVDLSVFRGNPFYRIFAGVNTGYLLTFSITNKTVTCD